MKVVQINSICGKGSTGKICIQISRILSEYDIENYVLYNMGTSSYSNAIKCSSDLYIKSQALKSRVFGNYGFNSAKSTNKIIAELEKIKPDVVLLHNIHSHDCSLEKLFLYFSRRKIKLFWTFHDCWVFTAYCPHFSMIKCDKWKTLCCKCPVYKEYSLFLDRSKYLYRKKKSILQNLDLTIITPSQWLRDLVKDSFLRNYPVKVINNGIDLDVFKPVKSDFRKKHSIPENKDILLGVAFGWDKRKGLDVFIELYHRLDKDQYQIVLVGTDDSTDKFLPNDIISIHRTNNQKELAEIYSSADLFLNPTREDNYPTVNMESIACGTPVLTFKTGGSPEMIDETCGSVVECDDVDSMEVEIKRICKETPFSLLDCINKSKDFDQNSKFKEYVNLLME